MQNNFAISKICCTFARNFGWKEYSIGDNASLAQLARARDL